ncbi:MAG TPA: tyrosine-type recombinase/integrase [Candidatus Micrarchaeaceae archaeon]|nr:tyrosine-type recombinase/integrase [Candidatus Micrarchaeaceae archaeon]
MSRRNGQNPKVRIGRRADGKKYFFFQYWVDLPGREQRQRRTEVLGIVGQITKSEAERKRVDFIQKLQLNSSDYRIPSSRTFADAVKFYREVFAPRMLRASTFSIADGHLKQHLETDWNEVPIEHIDIDAVNEWIWKKRQEGLSWVTVKNILRTMQRVLSCSAKDKKPPFSQEGLAIPDKDKLQMKIESRKAISFSWRDSKRIADAVQRLESLDEARKNAYSTVSILAAATGLRCGELFALRINDVDFRAGTIRVDESADQRTYTIGPCKNAAAYRTILLADREGREALRRLKRFIGQNQNPNALIFHSRRNTPLRDTNVLHDGLHPALNALGLPKAGMHAFRHGCNRRWELSGLNPAVIRQQMGHSCAVMTARYTGEIPIEQIRAAFSSTFGNKIVVLENMENEAVA